MNACIYLYILLLNLLLVYIFHCTSVVNDTLRKLEWFSKILKFIDSTRFYFNLILFYYVHKLFHLYCDWLIQEHS